LTSVWLHAIIMLRAIQLTVCANHPRQALKIAGVHQIVDVLDEEWFGVVEG
jgi:hypothetical protein